VTSLREKKKKMTFEAIRETAKDLFNKVGFEKVTIEDIASKAQVGVGTVYNYFKTKYAILFEVSMEENKRAIEAVRELIDQDYDDPVEHLLDLLLVHINPFFTLNRQMIIDMWVAFFKHNQYFIENYDFEEENEVMITMEMLKRFQNDGHLEPELNLLHASIALHGLVMMNYMLIIFPFKHMPINKDNIRDFLRGQVNILFYGMKNKNKNEVID